MQERLICPQLPSYQDFWHDFERDDLLPPGAVVLEKVGDPDSLGFRVEVDIDRLKTILNREGVRNGGNVKVIVDFDRGRLSNTLWWIKNCRGRKITRHFPRGLLYYLKDYVVEDCDETFGRVRSVSGGFETKVNVGRIYDFVLLTMSKEYWAHELRQVFHESIADNLAHEVGHMKQPPRFDEKGMALRFLETCLLEGRSCEHDQSAISNGWRDLSWAIESTFLRGLSGFLYKIRTAEQFAREYASAGMANFMGVVKTKTVIDKLRQDYPWRYLSYNYIFEQ